MSWKDIIKARRRVSRSILSIAIKPADPILLQMLLSGIDIPGVNTNQTPEAGEDMENSLFWSFVLANEAGFYRHWDTIQERLKSLESQGVIEAAEIRLNEVRV